MRDLLLNEIRVGTERKLDEENGSSSIEQRANGEEHKTTRLELISYCELNLRLFYATAIVSKSN